MKGDRAEGQIIRVLSARVSNILIVNNIIGMPSEGMKMTFILPRNVTTHMHCNCEYVILFRENFVFFPPVLKPTVLSKSIISNITL